MKKNELNKYEAPEVEIIEVKVEKGFAATGEGSSTGSDMDGEL